MNIFLEVLSVDFCQVLILGVQRSSQRFAPPLLLLVDLRIITFLKSSHSRQLHSATTVCGVITSP